jgi:hypothetical protein
MATHSSRTKRAGRFIRSVFNAMQGELVAKFSDHRITKKPG